MLPQLQFVAVSLGPVTCHYREQAYTLLLDKYYLLTQKTVVIIAETIYVRTSQNPHEHSMSGLTSWFN